MLSLSTIVKVQVNVDSAAATSTSFSTGLLLVKSDQETVPESQRLRLFTSAADMLTSGFTAADSAYLAAKAYFAASPAPDRLYVALYPSEDTIADAFSWLMDQTNDFYGVCLVGATEENIISFLPDYISMADRSVLFLAATGSVSSAIASEGLLAKAYATDSSRILTVYGADSYSAPALMGTAVGLARAYSSSAFALCYQQVPGMLPTDLTESEIASIKALNGNVYLTRGSNRKLLENGTVASGQRFDEVLALDRISADLQDAALSLLTSGTGKLPQTDETSAVFINRFSAVLSEFAAAGILATGIWRGNAVGSLTRGDVIENGYLLWADSYDLQSDSDRAAHKAMPIHVALCLSGSVETLVIDVDVTI